MNSILSNGTLLNKSFRLSETLLKEFCPQRTIGVPQGSIFERSIWSLKFLNLYWFAKDISKSMNIKLAAAHNAECFILVLTCRLLDACGDSFDFFTENLTQYSFNFLYFIPH